MKLVNGKITAAHILIVDDDKDIREALADGLELPGISLTITTAENAVTAIANAMVTPPDVIILDYNMPMGDGFSVAKEIRSNPRFKNTRIIMLTAKDTQENQWKSVDHDIDAFLGKPFELAEVEAHIYGQLVTIQQGGRRRKI